MSACRRGCVIGLLVLFGAGCRPADVASRSSTDPAMPVEVVVKLGTVAAGRSDARGALEECTRAFGLSVTPLHPGTTDPDLASYFVTHVAETAADAAIARLRECPDVEAAYVKPAGEPPGRM